LSPELKKHHTTDGKLIKSIILNTSKISRTSSVYGFIRLVRQKNNPNKKTLIYIPYASCHRNMSSYNPNCKITRRIINYHLIIITHPTHMSRYVPSVPTHIHPYMSKLRLLLETDNETNGLCLQWVPCMPETTVRGVHLLVYEIGRKRHMEVSLIICPFRNITGGREPALPSKHLEALK